MDLEKERKFVEERFNVLQKETVQLENILFDKKQELVRLQGEDRILKQLIEKEKEGEKKDGKNTSDT